MTFPEPPPNTPLVELEHALKLFLASVKSPKLVELPVVASVTYAMFAVFEPEITPPPIRPRVLFEQPAARVLVLAKSPKSVALPVVAIVK